MSETDLHSKKKKKSAHYSSNSIWNVNHKKIDEHLQAIYQKEDGEIPDMKKIEIKKTNIFLKSLIFVFFIGVILCVFAWINFFMAPNSKNVAEKYITLEFLGPDKIEFGNEQQYVVKFKNISEKTLNNVTLNLTYPSGFVFNSSTLPTKNSGHNEITLDSLTPFSEKSITISGAIYANNLEEKIWRASLNFQPEDTHSPLLKSVSFTESLENNPFELVLNTPPDISVGKQIVYTFSLKNTRKIAFSNLELVPSFPDGFQITSSSPELSTKDRWIIKTPLNNNSLLFHVQGIFKTNTDDTGVKAELFITPEKTTNRFQIAQIFSGNIPIPLSSSTEFTGPLILDINNNTESFTASPGEKLILHIQIKNTGKETMQDITTKVSLDSPSFNKQSILDWKTIKDPYDGDIQGEQLNSGLRHGQIIWNKKKIPALEKLEPGQEISFEVILPIKTAGSFNLASLTEHSISILSELTYRINSEQKTFSNKPFSILLNSDVALDVKSSDSKIVDGVKKFPISFIITNTYHPLQEITLSANLSEGLIPTENTFETPAGQATFNSETKKITWHINEMPESVDVLAWELSLSSKEDNSNLISNITLEATDSVSKQKIKLTKDDAILK